MLFISIWNINKLIPHASSLDDPVIEEPPSRLEPVESSWKVFLKFAENSTDDFEEALAKIQVSVTI